MWGLRLARVRAEVLRRLDAGGVLSALGSDGVVDRVEDGVRAG